MTRVVLVTGSRECRTSDVLKALDKRKPGIVLVGCCPTGADAAARLWCAMHDVACPVLIANWKTHGRKAGPKRNAHLVKVSVLLGAKVLAFPRGGPGTADCMRKARRAWLEVVEL